MTVDNFQFETGGHTSSAASRHNRSRLSIRAPNFFKKGNTRTKSDFMFFTNTH